MKQLVNDIEESEVNRNRQMDALKAVESDMLKGLFVSFTIVFSTDVLFSGNEKGGNCTVQQGQDRRRLCKNAQGSDIGTWAFGDTKSAQERYHGMSSPFLLLSGFWRWAMNQAMRDRVQKLEDHLKASKKKLNQLRTGKPGIKFENFPVASLTGSDVLS
jgi:hypothetical protein